MERPLVTIMIPVYNSAETLSRCLKSVLDQDYENLMVVALDNHSEDESYDIVLEYEKQNRERLYTGRTHAHVGVQEHRARCRGLISPRTRFVQNLAPTDVLAPTYVSRSVEVFDNSKRVGCVMTHAGVIHPSGEIVDVPRFRPVDCVISGDTQMRYFMAQGLDLNVIALYRIELFGLADHEGHIFKYVPDWLALAMASSISNMGYIHDSLAWRGDDRSRQNDRLIWSLEALFEQYIFLVTVNNVAIRLEKRRVSEQFPKALRRLSMECILCANRLVEKGEQATAKAYLSLALAFLPEIGGTREFQQTAGRFDQQPLDWH